MDLELLKEIAAVSEFHEDVSMDGYTISLLLTGMNGVYLCINTTHDDYGKAVYDAVKRKLGLRDTQLFLFCISDDDSGSFYDYLNGFVMMENIYDAYANCYANHLIPQADLFHIHFDTPASYCESIDYELACDNYDDNAENYIMPIISEKQIAFIEKKLVTIFSEPVANGPYRIYPDGRMEVKKIITQSVAGVSTFIESGTAYFPCMELEGDKFFMLTFLGGWFGLHKFKTGNYLKGLFYALTCGCCGVFYVLDLISIISGGYNYSIVTSDRSTGTVEFQKKRYYSRPLQNKKKAILFTFASVILSLLLVNIIYIPILDSMNVMLSSLLSDTSFAEGLANSL